MKRTIAVAALAAGLGSGHAALAADMPRPVYKAPPAAAAAYDWSGFYAGVHAGWGWSSGASGNASATIPGIVAGTLFARGYDLNDDGPLFGGQIGFNWQFGAAVVGIEGDISGTGISGFQSGPVTLVPAAGGFPGGTSHMRQDVNWLASIRARLGYTWGAGLLYVTGGAAWANIDYSADANPIATVAGGVAFPAAFSKTQSGWTVGGGYELALTPNWTIRTEYLYYNFDGASAVAPLVSPPPFAGSASYSWEDLDVHVIRVGANYKWGAGNPGSAAMAMAAAQSWSGFYAGVHGGWGWSSSANGTASSFTPFVAGPFLSSRSYDLSDDGPLFGGQVGFNWQFGAAVVGIEGDISGTGISGFQSGLVSFTPGAFGGLTGGTSHMRQDLNWLASVRGRLGYTWGPGLLYVTGGAAWANIDYSADANPPAIGGGCCAYPAALSKTQSGWTFGGGYEWALATNWTLRTEYLYYSFDGASAVAPLVAPLVPVVLAGSTATYTWDDLNIHAVRIALNYKW